MDNQQATDIEIGWLAGIIDGEGWIGVSVQTRYERFVDGKPSFGVKLEIKITNCDEAIIERSSAIMAAIGVNGHRRTHKQLGPDRRPVHEVSTKHMTSVAKILAVIGPHLTGNKRERADLMMRYIASRKSNPGVIRTDYPESGRGGARTIFPYTPEELSLVRSCRDLQYRGASETTRATREKSLERLLKQYASR